MRVYLSTVLNSSVIMNKPEAEERLKNTHILQSFAYNFKGVEKYYPMCKSVMLDSGAFTVMNSKNKRNSFDPMKYCKEYAEHIKKNNIELFLELDIEGVYGFEVYRDCLHQLQDITGRQPIMVFHKWRGLEYYKEIVKRVPYVALGDVSVGAGSREIYKYFPWFINEAHKNNCKVHGLAFTSMNDLQFMEFDSVDSSSHTSGARFAHPFRFDGHTVQTYDCKRTETRQLDHNEVIKLHDYIEWQKLSQYYDTEMEPVW